MNILFFMTPKSEITYVFETDTILQALRKMDSHHFGSIPIIQEKTGKYLGTLTEGDILWDLKNNYDLDLKATGDKPLCRIRRKRDYTPVNITARIEDILQMAICQNFVPVVDDTGAFIGIITRTTVMQYLLPSRKNGKEADKSSG